LREAAGWGRLDERLAEQGLAGALFTVCALHEGTVVGCGQATAKANTRDVIEPWDLPITRGLQESIHGFESIDEDIELRPILDHLAARPPLDAALSEDTQARLPLIFGSISVALARTFKIVSAELKAVHSQEWERAFSLFRLLI
jgi:hypothetical protein